MGIVFFIVSTVLIMLGCSLGNSITFAPAPTSAPLVASHLPLNPTVPNVQPAGIPTVTVPSRSRESSWLVLRSDRFSLMVPSSLLIDSPLTDVWVSPATAQLIFSGKDRQSALEIQIEESPAIFGTAARKLDNRKGDAELSRAGSAITRFGQDITVNGNEAAFIEYIRGGLAAVEYYIVAGREEVDIVIKQGRSDDTGFIATAERIANSFTLDSASALRPDQSLRADAFLPQNVNQTWWYTYRMQDSGETVDISSIQVLDLLSGNDGKTSFTLDIGANYNRTHDRARFVIAPNGLVLEGETPRGDSQNQVIWREGVPVLRLPLQGGQQWKTETQMVHSNNPTYSAPTTVEMQVEYRGPVTANGTNYPDCVRVNQTADGQLASKWTYCFEVGPVLIEQPAPNGMLQGELVGGMTARLIFSPYYENATPCGQLIFSLDGFDSGEKVDVRIVHPDGKTITHELIQIGTRQNIIRIEPTDQERFGAWTLYADGTTHKAMNAQYWPACN